jgi:GTP-binding protein EngB required for normal cell division
VELAPGSLLRELTALAHEAGASSIATEASALAERIREGRFYVAVVGQFKRGKSTLINALVGDPVLPAGVVPVTAVITVVRHGPLRGARVRMSDGTWYDIDPSDLAGFVSEEGNPNNAKGVAGVEVFVPSPMLASGLCLVDTPGLGSVFASGTAATRAFVPHIDAALVVLGADPPISEDELSLVKEVAQHVQDLVFVLNKADRVSPSECREARVFSEHVLAEHLHQQAKPILEVSAAERLSGGQPARDWDRLVDVLESLAREFGGGLVQAAEERGLRLLVARLQHELVEARDALTRPIEESERRVEALRRCAAEAEHAMNDLGYLLTAEQERLAKTFNARKDAFLRRTISDARRELSDELQGLSGRRSSLRSQGVDLAQDISRRWLDRWRTEEQPVAERLYRQAAERFVELANQFLERLATSGEPALAALPQSMGAEVGFRVKSRLYYTGLWRRIGGSVFRWLADWFRSREGLLRAIDRDTGEYLEALLYTNASRIENDLSDQVLESRRLLESEIRGYLREIHGSAERALSRARMRLSEGSDAANADLERMDRLWKRAQNLLDNSRRGEAS